MNEIINDQYFDCRQCVITVEYEWDTDDAGDASSNEGYGAGEASSSDPPAKQKGTDDESRDLDSTRDGGVNENVTGQSTGVQRHGVVHQTACKPITNSKALLFLRDYFHQYFCSITARIIIIIIFIFVVVVIVIVIVGVGVGVVVVVVVITIINVLLLFL